MRIDLSQWTLPTDNTDEPLHDIMCKALKVADYFFEDLHIYVRHNPFLTTEVKTTVGCYIYTLLRRRYLVVKTLRAWIYKSKNYEYANTMDLLLEDLSPTETYPTLIDNNKIYRFSPSDVRNIIVKKVVSGEFQWPVILPIKNPYTNHVITKTQLYNMYVSCDPRSSSWVLREYARADFENKVFLARHNSYLREQAVLEDIKSYTDREFKGECSTIFQRSIAYKFKDVFDYNGLANIPIAELRRVFTPIIVDSYVSYNSNVLKATMKRNLIRLWEKYPWILTKRSESKHTTYNRSRYQIHNTTPTTRPIQTMAYRSLPPISPVTNFQSQNVDSAVLDELLDSLERNGLATPSFRQQLAEAYEDLVEISVSNGSSPLSDDTRETYWERY